jgi:uncharacterized protein
MRELGVGLVYWPALAPLFESGEAAVVELEPQTLWKKNSTSAGFAYELNEELFDQIAALPQLKLLHGVGQPVGGTVDDPTDYVPLLQRMASRLEPAWISEHLSFNRVRRQGRATECGFLLPPPQTVAAARVASRNIERYRSALGYPVAFETGVNYLAPIAGELDDGRFFAEVAERADCGILLDLHNLLCNERNGRQRAVDALEQMPLNRVWEVHLGGGEPLEGVWLDAHCGAMPAELIDLAAAVMPRLPHVRAIVFEILPEHLDRIGLDGVHRQLEQMRTLWDVRPCRGPQLRIRMEQAPRLSDPPSLLDEGEVNAWEIRLVNALNDDAPEDPLSADRGCAVLRRLIRDARSASLVRGLRLTTTALLAGLGKAAVDRLLSDYFRLMPPEAFVALECHEFAGFLGRRNDVLAAVPYLGEILEFEGALLRATLFQTSSIVNWTVDPTQLIAALETGRLPQHLSFSPSRMTITAS